MRYLGVHPGLVTVLTSSTPGVRRLGPPARPRRQTGRDTERSIYDQIPYGQHVDSYESEHVSSEGTWDPDNLAGVTSHGSTLLVVSGGCTRPDEADTSPMFEVGWLPLSSNNFERTREPPIQPVALVNRSETFHTGSDGRPALSVEEEVLLFEALRLNMSTSEWINSAHAGMTDGEREHYVNLQANQASSRQSRDRFALFDYAVRQRALNRNFGDGQDPRFSLMRSRTTGNVAAARGLFGQGVTRSATIPDYESVISSQMSRYLSRYRDTARYPSAPMSAIQGNPDLPTFAIDKPKRSDSGYGSLGPDSTVPGIQPEVALGGPLVFRPSDRPHLPTSEGSSYDYQSHTSATDRQTEEPGRQFDNIGDQFGSGVGMFRPMTLEELEDMQMTGMW